MPKDYCRHMSASLKEPTSPKHQDYSEGHKIIRKGRIEIVTTLKLHGFHIKYNKD